MQNFGKGVPGGQGGRGDLHEVRLRGLEWLGGLSVLSGPGGLGDTCGPGDPGDPVGQNDQPR